MSPIRLVASATEIRDNFVEQPRINDKRFFLLSGLGPLISVLFATVLIVLKAIKSVMDRIRILPETIQRIIEILIILIALCYRSSMGYFILLCFHGHFDHHETVLALLVFLSVTNVLWILEDYQERNFRALLVEFPHLHRSLEISIHERGQMDHMTTTGGEESAEPPRLSVDEIVAALRHGRR